MNSISSHPSPPELAGYAARQLPAIDTLRVSDHLAGCADCREALARLALPGRGQAEDFLADPEDGVPDFEELAGAVEGTLTPGQRESLAARLAASPAAREALADLAAFHGALAALPPKTHVPAPLSAAGSVPAEANVPTGKLVPFPSRWTFWCALAAAALVLLSSAWWLVSGRPTPASQTLWADADLSRLPAGLRRGVESAARTGVVELPALPAELRAAAGTLAGSPPPPSAWRQIGPMGNVVRNDRPTLRWTAREGATGYVVYLVDTEGHGPMIRRELPASPTAWTPSTPLERGAFFQWQVEARQGNKVLQRTPVPPAPETRFQVLDERQNAELASLERRYARNPLILGTAFAQSGLQEDAERQFEELARRFPRSRAAQQLRQQLRSRARRTGD